MEEVLRKAINVAKNGGIVIYPTDTAFGIGCRIDNHAAVDRLVGLRRRPREQAMPVLVSGVEMALPYLIFPSDIVRRLMKVYWPGSLTIVSWCDTNRIYSPIRGLGKTVGLRMPDHQIALALIKAVGVPILGPSANFHGEPTPYRFEDLDPELLKTADCVIPGTCKTGIASTVIDCTTAPPTIIRKGAVDPIL